VALAILGMVRTLAPDRARASLAVVAAVIALAVPSALGQMGAILLGALVGMAMFAGEAPSGHVETIVSISKRSAIVALTIFAALLVGLPIVATATGDESIRLFDKFFRVGSLVFGGGHVVLPLLQAEVVPPGWISNDAFLAGYGAAQAVPGPLFTFAAYLGAIISGWKTGLLCLVAIFLPSFLLVIGVLPFWDDLRKRTTTQAALRGVNAAVVGLLIAAFYTPVWTSGVTTKADFGMGAAAFLLLFLWRTPPWLVVILSAAGGQLLAR
jgi:chromate transporter